MESGITIIQREYRGIDPADIVLMRPTSFLSDDPAWDQYTKGWLETEPGCFVNPEALLSLAYLETPTARQSTTVALWTEDGDLLWRREDGI